MATASLAAIVFVLISAVVASSLVGAAKLLRVRAKVDSPLKRRTYECGEEPLGPTWIQFHPRYYVVALVFVIFDLEAAFLLPWSLIVRELGMAGVIEVAVFALILMLGWAYAVKKDALKWQ